MASTWRAHCCDDCRRESRTRHSDIAIGSRSTAAPTDPQRIPSQILPTGCLRSIRRCPEPAFRSPRRAGNGLRYLDVNFIVAYRDPNRCQPYIGIARMAAGLDVEFIAVPRAHDVAAGRMLEARAFHVGRQCFLDATKNLALTNRAA